MDNIERSTDPLAISTWKHGEIANHAVAAIFSRGGTSLDAVEAGCRAVEENPDIRSVGLGGAPDISGEVTLDASFMDWNGNVGSVACMKDIVLAASVARKVMENTVHVMLGGEGAKQFAIQHGFEETDLLTDKSREEWKKYLENIH